MSYLPGLEEALRLARVGGPWGRERDVCTLCILIEHVEPGVEQDTLRRAAAGSISARALHRALRESGVRIARDSINNHRSEAHS